jgi:hypothetical protein
VSERIPLHKSWLYSLPFGAVLVILLAFHALVALGGALSGSSTLVRAGGCVLMLCPLGIILGLFYPTGMRLVQNREEQETPWYWALNGVAGVFSSALAVLISIQWGISTTQELGAVCYLLLLLCLPGMIGTGVVAGGKR